MLNQIRRKWDFEVCKLLAPYCNVEHSVWTEQVAATAFGVSCGVAAVSLNVCQHR